jgi:endoglucanase
MSTRSKLVLLLLIGSLGVAAIAAEGPAATGAGVGAKARGAQSSNPLEGLNLFVDRQLPSYLQYQRFRRAGARRKAALIWKIAREPKSIWLGRFTRPNFDRKVREMLRTARSQGQVPVFTVLRAQSTKCSPNYQGGGRAEDRRTRAWYDDLARVIGDERVVIGFEPDSLGTIDCLARSRRDDRLRLLAYGVKALAQRTRAIVYIEAGAADWEPAKRAAKQLRIVGIRRVRGFMLNATHSDWTRANIKHGLAISRRTGGKHFIINTAENGRGPVFYRRGGRRITVWCNPGMRGLGPPPTTNTAHPKVDAYLWINRPGFAQVCQGRPISWYLPRALSYARYATNWLGPPPGTRYGFSKRYPLSRFGIP